MAVVELVKAKMEGRKIEAPKAPELTRPTDLMEALRQSAEVTGAHAAKPKRTARKSAAAKPKTTKREKAA
jgi:DNA end-binding protein Ku